MKIILAFLGLSFLIDGQAQNFEWKSNEIHISNKNSNGSTVEMPEISWVTPRTEFTMSTETMVEIEAIVTSKVPIKQVLIIVGEEGNRAIQSSKSLSPPAEAFTYAVKQTVNLLDKGAKFIEIEVENSLGGKISSTRFIRIGMDAIADAISIDRKDYALLIATDKYDYWRDLVNPVNDAQAIAKELKDRFGFETELLLNSTQDEIISKIREYSKRRFRPQDQLFIFFAGHGHFDETFGEGYVVAKNSLESDRTRTTLLAHSNLRSYINNIPCEHILLTMDVCFGGTFDPVIAKSRSDDNDYNDLTGIEYFARKLTHKTRKYITSGGKEYVSDGVLGKNSPFAAKFIEALKSNGGADRILTVNEINSYLEKIRTNEPRSGDFGDGQKSADFVFVAKQ